MTRGGRGMENPDGRWPPGARFAFGAHVRPRGARPTIVGRSSTADVRFFHTRVSRRHLSLEYSTIRHARITDLWAPYGTWVWVRHRRAWVRVWPGESVRVKWGAFISVANPRYLCFVVALPPVDLFVRAGA